MIDMTLTVVGAGNMGYSLMAGILDGHLMDARNIMVSNRSRGKLERIKEKWNVNSTYDNSVASRFGQILILAVKPHDMKEAVLQIKQHLQEDQLIISVAAGIRIETIREWLQNEKQPIVRVMPNTPVQLAEGMCGWVATNAVTKVQRQATKQILSALGKEIYLEDEALLDQVTAISGSGPAYIFYLAESLIKSAEAIGLSQEHSKELVLQTVWGAAKMLRENGKAPADLRAAVTSKGGTTEAAIKEFQVRNLQDVITRGVRAAYERGMQIGVEWHTGR